MARSSDLTKEATQLLIFRWHGQMDEESDGLQRYKHWSRRPT